MGGTWGALTEVVDRAEGRVNLIHYTDLQPFPAGGAEPLERAKKLVAVEQNFTGQLARYLRGQTGIEISDRILKYDGRQMTPAGSWNSWKRSPHDHRHSRPDDRHAGRLQAALRRREHLCVGCGDFGILAALQQALVQLEIAPHRVMILSGIGCGSKLPDYIHSNGWQTLHGRSLPAAQGFRLVQHDMTVLAVTGDGDGLGEGGNHWLHAMRRNVNFTHLVENNQTYGLTKGQASPTSDIGYISSTTPEGNVEFAVNPISTALGGRRDLRRAGLLRQRQAAP